jgi:hypothetical protein
MVKDNGHLEDQVHIKNNIKMNVQEIMLKSVVRDIVVGIATCYGLDGPGIESRWGQRFSSLLHTGPGAYTASSSVGTTSLSRG